MNIVSVCLLINIQYARSLIGHSSCVSSVREPIEIQTSYLRQKHLRVSECYESVWAKMSFERRYQCHSHYQRQRGRHHICRVKKKKL